jgi:hypothetical protein
LLAFGGTVLDVFAGAAGLGRYFSAAWAGLLFLSGLWRCHDGSSEVVVDAELLFCRLLCGGEVRWKRAKLEGLSRGWPIAAAQVKSRSK